MAQLRLILPLVLLATLQIAECSHNGLGGHVATSEKITLPRKILSPSILPLETEFVPYRGNIANLHLSARLTLSDQSNMPLEKCIRWAINTVADVYRFFDVETCYSMKLSGRVCRVAEGNETGYMIRKRFLTDGSPNDDPFPVPGAKYSFMYEQQSVDMRVMTPTILEFPEFTSEMDEATYIYGVGYNLNEVQGKTFVLPKRGGILITDSSILVDPSCHTNNLCGVPIMAASVEIVQTPHVFLDAYCGQTIDLIDTPALHVFSHPGIGCKLFPDVYPTPNCELTITSPGPFTANVTLVNFRKTTCGGYELKFVTFPSGVSKEVDACQENAPTIFKSLEGKMHITLAGSASENWRRYGFIIRLEKVTKNDNSSQCSSDNSVQCTTEDFTQVSTTASAESPTNSPVQGAPDGFPQVSTTAPVESPTNSPVQGAPDGFPQVSTTGPAESPTNSPVQGATDGFPQVSTTASAESPTNNPVQNPTDGSDADLPDASLESSSATEFIRDPTEIFESESPSVSPKRPRNPHHLHMLLALGIEL